MPGLRSWDAVQQETSSWEEVSLQLGIEVCQKAFMMHLLSWIRYILVTFSISAPNYIIGTRISASRDIRSTWLRAGTLGIIMDFGTTTLFNVHITIGLLSGLVGLGIFILFLVLITCGPWADRRRLAWAWIKSFLTRNNTCYPNTSNRVTQVWMETQVNIQSGLMVYAQPPPIPV